MLRSQDGVEEVDNPYGNLQKGVVQIKTAKGKPIDLARLVQLLEEQVGFEPITDVSLEVRGRLKKQNGALVFEVSESGRIFTVAKVESKDGTPPEKELLAAVASLENPHSPDRIVLREWRRAQVNQSQR